MAPGSPIRRPGRLPRLRPVLGDLERALIATAAIVLGYLGIIQAAGWWGAAAAGVHVLALLVGCVRRD